MRTTFILLILAMANQVNGQTFKINPPATKTCRPSTQMPKLNSDIFDTTSLWRLNGKNYLAKLGQDNMPCIIPLPSKPEMPNGYYDAKNQLGKIPNTWDGKDSIAGRKSIHRGTVFNR